MAMLLERLAALEQKQKPSTSAFKKEIIQYAMRPQTDFDKYVVLAKIEELKNLSRDLRDTKSDFYASVYSMLMERIDKPSNQFKDYVLSLLGDKDYGKILESINKIDKIFSKKASPIPSFQYQPHVQFSSNSRPYHPYNAAPIGRGGYNSPRGGRGFNSIRPTPYYDCTYCHGNNHTAFNCFKRRGDMK